MPSVSPSPAAGIGVALLSDVLSAGIDGLGSILMVADEAEDVSCGKRARRSGESRSVIILLFLPAFEAFDAGVDMLCGVRCRRQRGWF